MVTLSNGFNWDPDSFNGASFLGGAVALAMVQFLLWAMWRIAVRDMIDQHRLNRQAERELQLDLLRTEIRLQVEQALSGDEEDDQGQRPGPGGP